MVDESDMELVITLDDDLAARARAEAERRGLTLDALLRGYLAEVTSASDQVQAVAEFLRLASQPSGEPEPGWRFKRAELYDRRL